MSEETLCVFEGNGIGAKMKPGPRNNHRVCSFDGQALDEVKRAASKKEDAGVRSRIQRRGDRGIGLVPTLSPARYPGIAAGHFGAGHESAFLTNTGIATV
jgi:hypothetical protein